MNPSSTSARPDPAAGVERRHRHAVAAVVVVVEPVELVELDEGALFGIGVAATERPVDVGRRSSAVGDRVDQRARPLGGVATGPHVGHRGASGVVVDLDRAARADVGSVGAQRLQVDRLTDRQDHRVGLIRLTVGVVELGCEPAVGVEHGRDPDRLDPGHSAVLDDHMGRPASGHETDALVLGFLDFEVVGRHLVAGFE